MKTKTLQQIVQEYYYAIKRPITAQEARLELAAIERKAAYGSMDDSDERLHAAFVLHGWIKDGAK